MNLSRRFLGSFCAALAVSFAITGGASQAFAGTITFPSIEISIEGNSAKFTYSPSASDYRRATNADGGYELTEQKHFDILGNLAHLTIEQLQWDPDPFVLNNILVTNTTDSTLTFSAFVGLPTTFPAPNSISGNVSASVIDGGRRRRNRRHGGRTGVVRSPDRRGHRRNVAERPVQYHRA